MFNDIVYKYFFERDLLCKSRRSELNNKFNTIPPIRCEICHYNFSGRFPLKKHMDTHMSDEDKPFICDKCPNRYTKSILLARHIFESHSTEEDKKFHCELCDKK